MTYLREHSLTHIANAVAEQIEEGVVKKEKVTIDLTALEEEYKNTTSTKMLYRRGEYTPREQLNILLDTIENAMINPFRVRRHIGNFFNTEAGRSQHLHPLIILDPGIGDTGEPVELDLAQSEREMAELAPLIQAIDDLRKELNSDIGQ